MSADSKAHSFMGTNCGPQAEEVWSRLLDRTCGLMESCQPVFAIYSDLGAAPAAHRRFTRSRADYLEHLFQMETCVVEIFDRREVFEALGATDPFFEAAATLGLLLRSNLETVEDKLSFAKAATDFATLLPLKDPVGRFPHCAHDYDFPNLSKRPLRYAAKVLKHASRFKKLVGTEAVAQQRPPSPSKTHSQYSLNPAEGWLIEYAEDEDASVNKGGEEKPSLPGRKSSRRPTKRTKTLLNDLEHEGISSKATTEVEGRVFIFDRYYAVAEIPPKRHRVSKMESRLQSKYTGARFQGIVMDAEALLESKEGPAPSNEEISIHDASSGIYGDAPPTPKDL